MYHAASQDFHPSSVLAESTAFSSTDVARDIHLRRRLGEREIRRTQADFSAFAEHLLCEEQQYLLQVGERHLLIDIKALHLMEEAVGTCRDGLVTVDASWANDAYRRLLTLHHTALHR